jgi:hypothetical protein
MPLKQQRSLVPRSYSSTLNLWEHELEDPVQLLSSALQKAVRSHFGHTIGVNDAMISREYVRLTDAGGVEEDSVLRQPCN